MTPSGDYDVIVVGSGLGGLSAAALLARAGLHVAVAERSARPGGYAQAFRRGDYLFDPAIHVTLDAGKGQFTGNLFDHLGVGDQVRFVTTPHTFRADYPGLSVHAPPGRGRFLAEHQRLFPGQADELQRLFDAREALFRQLSALPHKLGARGLEDAMAAAPLVFKYRMATVADFVSEFVTDPRCAAVFTSLWPYIGSPPSRLSFLLFNQMLETLHKGSYYPLGGFSTLVDALVAALRRGGGELMLGNAVTRIVVDEGRATGVELADGRRLSAHAVVANADATHTFGDLVGWDTVPGKLRKRIERSQLSPSAFVIYGVLHADPVELGLAHENFVFSHFDHDQTWDDIQAGRPGGIWVNVPTLTDESLAPDGTHLAIVTSLAPPRADGSWQGIRDGYASDLLATIDPLVPDAKKAIEIVDIATPDTFRAFTGNSEGAIYGWENIPAQTASKRLPHRTPIDRLYLSGHWSEEGGSSLRVLTSGRATAAMVVADLGRGEEVPDFGGASLADEGG